MGSCPPNYNIGWAANVFCPSKKFCRHISSRPNKQYRPTVLYSTNRKLRSTSIESTHPSVESAHPMKKSFLRYCRQIQPIARNRGVTPRQCGRRYHCCGNFLFPLSFPSSRLNWLDFSCLAFVTIFCRTVSCQIVFLIKLTS